MATKRGLFTAITFVSFAARQVATPPPLALRLLADSVQLRTRESLEQAQVRFMARNTSGQRLYHLNDCLDSPRYSVDRLESVAGHDSVWRTVYVPKCSPPRFIRTLASGDSMVISVSVVERTGADSHAVSPKAFRVYRFVFRVEAAKNASRQEVRLESPAVYIAGRE
jgi:hypothetical protein